VKTAISRGDPAASSARRTASRPDVSVSTAPHARTFSCRSASGFDSAVRPGRLGPSASFDQATGGAILLTMTTTAPRRAATGSRARIRDRGQIDALVLAALADGPKRQDEIAETLRSRVGDRLDLPYSRIVPTLHRLQRNRLVSRPGSDPRRYRLTDTGTRSLAARRRAADTFAAAVHQLADAGGG
jgi:DNA-binding PadR family transcriptional regulator